MQKYSHIVYRHMYRKSLIHAYVVNQNSFIFFLKVLLTLTINLRFLVIASGKRVPIEGFDRRSLDAKLSIAVTANFVNTHTPEEAEVRQISGLAKHFHQVRKVVVRISTTNFLFACVVTHEK